MTEKAKLYLLDMDGTVYVGDRLICGAKEKIDEIRGKGKSICFLTNNSSRAPAEYLEKLFRLGIDAGRGELYTSADSAVRFLKKRHAGESVFLLGTEKLASYFEEEGIRLTETDPDIVLLAYDTELTYKKLAKTVTNLATAKHYYATHSDINCPAAPVYLPDVGSFIALIEKSTGKTPETVFGKPFTHMGEAIKEKFSLPADEIAVVGDRIYTDIMFAKNNGFTSVLVLSGETALDDYEKNNVKADAVLGSIKDMSV